MKIQLRIGTVLMFAMFIAAPARAQILIETAKILTPKTKDLGEIIDKATKGPKAAAQPRVETPASGRPSATASRPTALPDTFSSDTEPPESILDINAEVLTRFSAALAAEGTKRDEGGTALTRGKYDAIGAEAGGFTSRQYFVLKARVRPFCDAVVAGQAPPNDLRFSYMPTESMAIKPRCAALAPALKKVQ
ncbi:MAG TPA: hypothetical protein VIF83_14595 [Gemmatimonadaceae bacterium]|jgi:hypothetical protein